jgi:hypothetical protein
VLYTDLYLVLLQPLHFITDDYKCLEFEFKINRTVELVKLRGMKRNARSTKEVFTSLHKNNAILLWLATPQFLMPYCSGQLEEQSW